MEMNIALSSDRNYCKLLAITIISLFENNKDVENIIVYCLLFNPGNDYKREITNIGNNYGRKICIIEINEICEEYRFWESGEDGRYIRLLLPKLLFEVDKVLYLDCDIMIRRNLSDLFAQDISVYYHAAVLDTARMNARLESDIENTDMYFNSGVMLMNLAKWREDHLEEQFKTFKLSHSNKGVYRDQRVLNGITSSNYLILPPTYNFMPEFYQFKVGQLKQISEIEQYYSQKDIDTAKENPHIVHFSGRSIDRPWFNNSRHKYTKEYRKYMKKTKFTSIPLLHDTLKNTLLWNLKRHLPFFILKYFILKKNKVR